MPKKKRYINDPENAPEIWTLTDLDKAILSLALRYAFVRGVFAKRIIGRIVNYSLLKLTRLGFITKPPWQFRGWNTINSSDLYCLMPAGYEVMGLPVPKDYRLHRLQYPTSNTNHDMAIYDLMMSVEIAVKEAGLEFISKDQIEELTTHPDPFLFDFEATHTFKDSHTEHLVSKIRMDWAFAIKYGNGKTKLFFLEVENESPPYRNTLGEPAKLDKRTGEYTHGGNSSSLRKWLAYENIRKRKVMWDRFRKHDFTVIFAYTKPEHFEKAKHVIQTVTNESDLFLFVHIPAQHITGRSPQPYPEVVGGPLWRVGLPPLSILETPVD